MRGRARRAVLHVAVARSRLETRRYRRSYYSAMAVIILEGVLFVALVATCGALFFFVVRHYTSVGKRLAQSRNRRRLERAADLTCPIHGAHAERDLVRLTSGETVCPECFKETMYGKLDG